MGIISPGKMCLVINTDILILTKMQKRGKHQTVFPHTGFFLTFFDCLFNFHSKLIIIFSFPPEAKVSHYTPRGIPISFMSICFI